MKILTNREKLALIFLLPLMSLILLIPLDWSFGQGLSAERFEINLKSGTFTPPEDITSVLESLSESPERERVHVLMQFKTIPDSSVKAELRNAGVKLLNYIPKNTWFASVPSGLASSDPALSSVRWIGRIIPDDKIAPGVRDKGKEDEKINLVIKYFSDVSAGEVRKRLEGRGAAISGEAVAVNSVTVSVIRGQISALADEDAIRWIEPVPPRSRGEAHVIRIRNHVQSATAQSVLGLSGNGVTVGILEDSHAYGSHPDLSGRLTKGDTDPTNYHYHATNVAGVIGGNGDSNHKGMAPAVEMYSYDYSAGATTADEHNNYIGDLQTAVISHSIDIANNSWGSAGCDEFAYGDYLGLSPAIDGIVHGDFGRPVTVVFSAGNERWGFGAWDSINNEPSDQHCIGDKDPPYANYATMNHPKSAKNIIAVGAVDSFNNRMSTYSSWGPTGDGRIKPEIVASGHHNGLYVSGVSDARTLDHTYWAPHYPTSEGLYSAFYQTSCAAAAASGSIALLFEDYRDQYSTLYDPLPSTVKALLIHTAKDLDDTTTWYNKGPDYASGFGLLQIKDAIDLMRSGAFIERKVNHGGEWSFIFTVPANASSVKVTLVWDDVPGAENANPALVNDLNLHVVDDQGVHHHPWTLNPGNPSAPAVRQTGSIANGVDHINNVEQVVIDLDGTGPGGIWSIIVTGHNVPEGPQAFSLIANEVGCFIDNNDGTVTDVCLNVMWLKDANYAETSGYDADGKMTWNSAETWASTLSLPPGGYADWRQPTHAGNTNPRPDTPTSANEIGSLWTELGGGHDIWMDTDISPFVNLDMQTGSAWYWTGSPDPNDPSKHWRIDLTCACWDSQPAFGEYYAWAVRDILPSDTPTGSEAEVTPEPGVTIIFGTVSSGGETTVEVSTENPGTGGTGFGFEFFGNFYDIHTTADYSDAPGAENVEVCLAYNESDLPAGTNEEDIVVKRWNGSSWEDAITSTVDTTNNIACGTFPNLSWFGIAVTIDSDDDGIPDGDGTNPCTGGITMDCDDNCPDTPNPLQEDMDDDLVGDACDNCRERENWDQHDSNAGEDDNPVLEGMQHYGNACDPDFNNNGIVDIIDLSLWRQNVGDTVPPAPDELDINGDGVIWLQDLAVWRQYYGTPPGPGIGD